MRRHFFIISMLLLTFYQYVSALEANITLATFKSHTTPYFEIYTTISGNSVAFKRTAADTSLFEANVNITLLIKQNEQIIQADKIAVTSPLTKSFINFSTVQRFALKNGAYTLELKLEDALKNDNVATYSFPFTIQYSDNDLELSDIQLLSKFEKSTDDKDVLVKNGFHLETLPIPYYGKNASQISFYCESYNSNKKPNDSYQFSYAIHESKNNDAGNLVMIAHKRRDPKEIDPMILQMDISQLPTGNYFLVIEARDRDKNLLSHKQIFFQRSNPYLKLVKDTLSSDQLSREFVGKLTDSELKYGLKAIFPKIGGDDDVEIFNLVLKQGERKAMQNFLFNYWVSISATNPKYAYDQYMALAKVVDEKFMSGLGYGFETDRGYIYLKYGQPTERVEVEDDPTAPPYEVWTYDRLYTNQQNVKFVFYNPSLVTNDFKLLHSNARGEVSNPQWKRILYKKAPNEILGNNFDGLDVMDNFNRNASRIYKE
ncbi:MAG: GWxTD domain-containing protein [Saprospiraceae bacterium]|nr:GWxTD domain-containing protein [Saprospiraceae bacterium]